VKLCIVDDAGNVHEVTDRLELYLDPSPPITMVMSADPDHPGWADQHELEELLDDIKATGAFARELAPKKAAAE
jgi:hypothetical protein